MVRATPIPFASWRAQFLECLLALGLENSSSICDECLGPFSLKQFDERWRSWLSFFRCHHRAMFVALNLGADQNGTQLSLEARPTICEYLYVLPYSYSGVDASFLHEGNGTQLSLEARPTI